MKKFLKPVLLLVAVTSLTACDKQVTKAEAAQRAAAIQQVEEDPTSFTIKSVIEVSAVGNSYKNEITFAVDNANNYLYLNSKSGSDNLSAWVYLDGSKLIYALESNENKVYQVLTENASQYSQGFDYVTGIYEKIIPDILDIQEDVLAALAKGSDDVNEFVLDPIDALGLTGLNIDLDTTYFSNDERSVGFKTVANASYNGVGKVTLEGEYRFENNFFRKSYTKFALEALGQKMSLFAEITFNFGCSNSKPRITNEWKEAA